MLHLLLLFQVLTLIDQYGSIKEHSKPNSIEACASLKGLHFNKFEAQTLYFPSPQCLLPRCTRCVPFTTLEKCKVSQAYTLTCKKPSCRKESTPGDGYQTCNNKHNLSINHHSSISTQKYFMEELNDISSQQIS